MNAKDNQDFPVIMPTGPGSNPSSFPRVDMPVKPEIDLPEREDSSDYIRFTDGTLINMNGAVIDEERAHIKEVEPPNKYTPDKEDLDLLIM